MSEYAAKSAVPDCTYLFILLLVTVSVVCCCQLGVTNSLINCCKGALSVVQEELPTNSQQLVLEYQYFFLPPSPSLSSSSQSQAFT